MRILVVNDDGITSEGIKRLAHLTDCVKAALYHLMPERPDIVFSGINYGYNCGYDILYSGTVGAAMEALSAGIPAIAFSKEMNDIYDVVDE